MPTGDNPVSQLRRLRAELRQLRETRGHTQKDVADALDWSPSKLIRIEKGQVGVSVTDVRALLQHYGVTDAEHVEELVDLARASKKPAWWHKYREFLTPEIFTFLGLEASSIRIQQYQGLVVPGLLQHEDYLRTLSESGKSDPREARAAVEIRLTRQKLVDDTDRELSFILDEAVLHRVIGSPEIMRAQLRKLIDLQDRPNVMIRVLPFAMGVHKGMKGSFSIFALSDAPEDYAMQQELYYGDRLIDEPSDETTEYVRVFMELEKLAPSPEESVAIIERVLASFGGES